MRLTVGPLPPAVYWRRRVVILGTLLLIVLVFAYSCSNASDAAGRKRVLRPSTDPPSHAASASASAANPLTPSPGFTDQVGGDPPVDPGPSATPAGPESQTAIGPCADDDMALTAAADPPSAARAAFVKFTLRIKNISNRPCTRDVGVDPQELYLQDAAKVKVWSSDTCDTRRGIDVRTFKPGDVAEFFVSWNGRTNNTGCSDQQPPAAGRYQLYGRLATKLSEPGTVDLR